MNKTPMILVGIIILALVGLMWWKTAQTSKYSIDVSQPAVIKQLQALNRYETTSFTIEKIIEAGTTEGNALNDFLYGDRMLLIAHGEVIGGFDFAKVKEEDVSVINKSITIQLPAPEILVTRLDSDKTRVYDRQQGLLNQGDKDLESQARQAAEDSIREAACAAGILSEASDKAQAQLTILFKSAGFETVIIKTAEGSC